MIHHLKKMRTLKKANGESAAPSTTRILSTDQDVADAQRAKELAANAYLTSDEQPQSPQKERHLKDWAAARDALRNYEGGLDTDEAPQQPEPAAATPEMQEQPRSEITDSQVQQYRDKYNLGERPRLEDPRKTEIGIRDRDTSQVDEKLRAWVDDLTGAEGPTKQRTVKKTKPEDKASQKFHTKLKTGDHGQQQPGINEASLVDKDPRSSGVSLAGQFSRQGDRDNAKRSHQLTLEGIKRRGQLPLPKSVEKTAQNNPKAQYPEPGNDTAADPEKGELMPHPTKRINVQLKKMKKMLVKKAEPTDSTDSAEKKAELMGYK